MTGHPAHVGEVMCRHEKASVAAARIILNQISLDDYYKLYQEYLLPNIPNVVIPEIPHGEFNIPHVQLYKSKSPIARD
jgi:hypothetical protein